MLKKKRRSRAPRVKVQDAFSNPLARLGFDTPNIMEGTQYTLQRLTRDFNMLNALYRENWIIRRIIDTIPSDMLKNGFTITTELGPELLKRFDRELRTTQLIEKLRKGLKWGRLYGGALGVMLIQGQGDDLSEPLDLELIMPGDFAGLMILDRWNGVSPSSELVDDIADPEYGLPKYYNVTDPVDGTMICIHHSRCVRFVGNDLPYWEELSEVMWGASVVESVFDELKKRDNVSWNIAQLTFMANMRILKMNDLGQLLASTDSTSQQELYRTIQAQNVLMNNMGLMVMDAADSIESHQYTFGGLAECYQQFIMDIAGAAEIPVTRLFGRSPAGLNATGESDLQNYYEMIAEKQETYLRPIFSKLLPVICMSVFGAVPDDLDFEFDPVAEPSDKQRADLAKTGTDIVVSAVGAGLVSPRTGLKELKQQSERTNVWTNITDEDIEKASDEIDQGEMDMGGFPGMGGDGPTDGPQGPEGDEKVETTAPPTSDARGLKHAAIDNCIDVNGDEHDTLGRFTGGNNNLNNLLENGSIGSTKLKSYPELTKLLREKGMASQTDEAMKPVKIKILAPGVHGSKQLAKRNITLADAQSYVDNAFIMIKQSADKYLYIADDGSSAVVVNGRLSTAFPASWYDEKQLRKIEVIKKWLKTMI